MITNATPFVFSPQQQYLFGRCYALAVGAPYQTTAIQYANFQVTDASGKAQPPSPLRVTFDIEKNLVGSPNKSKIQLYNLSLQTRQLIKKGWVVRVQAGYKGLVETIFFGNIAVDGLKTERKQAEIILTMECLDGGSAITMATLDKSYGPGTTLAQVLKDVGQAMATPTSYNPQGIGAGVAVGIPDIVYGNGLVVTGQCRDTLDKLLKDQGLRWTVENGNLNIIPLRAHNGQSAILVSKQTGMIGTPSQNQYTEFTSLLNPKLIPGALVKLESDNTSVNGFYKINKSHFEGDTHDNKWQVTCQCIQISGVSQTLKASNGFNYDTAVV